MHARAHAEVGRIPDHAPTFHTERFMLAPLNPPQLRRLLEVVLQDEPLAQHLPWMVEKSADGALREAFLLELEAVTGTLRGWGIVERASRTFVGAMLARQSLAGIDIEVLCPSHHWDQGISDEVAPELAEWLEEHTEVDLVFRQ